jgi:hypothetical protein
MTLVVDKLETTKLRKSYLHLSDMMTGLAYMTPEPRRYGLEYVKLSFERLHAVEYGVDFEEAFSPEIRVQLAELRAKSFGLKAPVGMEVKP